MDPSRSLAILLAALLAGCVQAQAPAPGGTDTGTAAPAPVAEAPSAEPEPAPLQPATAPASPFPHEFWLEGCLNPRMLFFLDPAVAQANLPPGYKAADATGLLRYMGFPQPPAVATGRAVAGYDFLSCPRGSLGAGEQRFSEVGIFIDSPSFGNGTPAVATNLDLYLLAFHTTSPDLQRLLLAGGFQPNEALLGTIDSGQSFTADTAFKGHGAIAAGAPLASADWAGMGSGNALAVHGRYWHTVDAGTFYIDFKLDELVYAGAIASCAHAEGSAYERATGTKSCGPEPRFAAVGVNSTIAGGMHWMPGVRPH
jgi:hypothetical protein